MRTLGILLLCMGWLTMAHATITTDAYITGSDVTIDRLNLNQNRIVNEINSFPGGNLQTATVSSDKLTDNANPVKRWNDVFNDFVITGLLPPTTTGTLTATTTSGRAIIDGEYVQKDATAHTYGANTHTYVDLSKSGTYTYEEVALGAAEPAVTANSIRLARVSTDATQVGQVRDDRDTSASIGTNEDFYIKGLELQTVSGDATGITVDAGVCYVGSTRVNKTAKTNLVFATANDWWDGVADTVNTWCYVGVDNSGNVKLLGNNPPDRADTSGNTAGVSRYWYDGTVPEYWRVIGAVSQDASNQVGFYFTQMDDKIIYENAWGTETMMVKDGASGGGALGTWVSVDCSTKIPGFSTVCNLAVETDAAARVNWRANDSTYSEGQKSSYISAGNYTERINNAMLDSSQMGEATSAQLITIWIEGFDISDIR